jgi:hypothetical protein
MDVIFRSVAGAYPYATEKLPIAMSDEAHRLREQELRCASSSLNPPSCQQPPLTHESHALQCRRDLNEKLDKQKEQFMRQASQTAREQEERLARMGTPSVDSMRLSRELRRSEAAAEAASASADPEPSTTPTDPGSARGPRPSAAGSRPNSARGSGGVPTAAARLGSASSVRPPSTSTNRLASASGGPSLGAEPPPPLPVGTAVGADAAGLGSAADLRLQKAQLTVTLEEVERLRAQLADKTSALAEAETMARELQQRVGRAERAERSTQHTLEKERAAMAEEMKRAEALERELSLLRKDSDENARRERSQAGDQRTKDVRLHRALEELPNFSRPPRMQVLTTASSPHRCG